MQDAPAQSKAKAQVHLSSVALTPDIAFFTHSLGMRLDAIYPADNPQVAILSGHGIAIRLDTALHAPAGLVHLQAESLADFADTFDLSQDRPCTTSPGGTRITLALLRPPLPMPLVQPEFTVHRMGDKAPWVIGRAGMQYRDLVPSRLAGAMIASHIRVTDGPVADSVHFHQVGFQLIFCIQGWVDVLYEDQGGVRRLQAGDCFIQPPTIRHRVLQSGENMEVIEIGLPAEHLTEMDHTMTLPTTHLQPEREWQGQRFVHSIGSQGIFKPFRIPGFEARDTGVQAGTKGVASVLVVQPTGQPTAFTHHSGTIVFNFAMQGQMGIRLDNQEVHPIRAGDAFVIPPHFPHQYINCSDDLQLLEVSLPGNPATSIRTSS